MPVQMELKRIIISEVHEQQVIVLKEVDGERSFPIVIGIFEATSIDRRVKGMPSPRPLTHDLVASRRSSSSAANSRTSSSASCSEHTYFAKLRIRQDGETDRGRLPAQRRHRPGRHRQGADLRRRGSARRGTRRRRRGGRRGQRVVAINVPARKRARRLERPRTPRR